MLKKPGYAPRSFPPLMFSSDALTLDASIMSSSVSVSRSSGIAAAALFSEGKTLLPER